MKAGWILPTFVAAGIVVGIPYGLDYLTEKIQGPRLIEPLSDGAFSPERLRECAAAADAAVNAGKKQSLCLPDRPWVDSPARPIYPQS